MPEGPEIRRAADRIEKVIGGQRANEVFFAFNHLAPYADELQGRTVTKVETRGKALLTWFDNDVAVYSHNQLYGRWYVRKSGEPKTNRQLRFAVYTDAGRALLYSASDIAVLGLRDLDQHEYLRKLGPDPLLSSTSASVIRRRLRDDRFRRRSLGALLLDQSFLAGLGNYLRSEILFVSGLRPEWRPMDLDDDEVSRLARSVNLVIRRSYKTGGVTNDAKRVRSLKAQGQKRREYRHYVFAREGAACRECGEAIEKIEIGGRRLYYCPDCQR